MNVQTVQQIGYFIWAMQQLLSPVDSFPLHYISLTKSFPGWSAIGRNALVGFTRSEAKFHPCQESA